MPVKIMAYGLQPNANAKPIAMGKLRKLDSQRKKNIAERPRSRHCATRRTTTASAMSISIFCSLEFLNLFSSSDNPPQIVNTEAMKNEYPGGLKTKGVFSITGK